MFERQIKSQLSSKVVKVITIVFVTLFVLSCVIALSGCSEDFSYYNLNKLQEDCFESIGNYQQGLSKIHEKGSRFIIEKLKENGIEGLVPSHGDILVLLYKYEKLTMKDIAEKIHRTKPTVTVLADKLEKLGYVERKKSMDDNRITYITLTEKGRQFKPLFEKISKDLNNLLYKNLTGEEAQMIDKLLEKMV